MSHLILLGCLAFLSGCSTEPAGHGLSRGDKVPSLEFRGFDGSITRLESFRGRLLVLNLWAPWCAPCLEEMPSLERLSRQLDADRYAVIGLTVDDDRFLAEEFIRENLITFPNFLDEKRSIIEAILRVDSFPQTLLIGPDGILLARIIGWRQWDGAEVIAALEKHYQAWRQSSNIISQGEQSLGEGPST